MQSLEQEDNSRIYVSVNVDGHNRKVEIFDPDDGIYFREEFNSTDTPILSDEDIVRYRTEEAHAFFVRSGSEWNSSWSRRGQ